MAVKADGTYSTWGKMGVKTGTLSPKTIMVTGTQKDIDNDLVEVSLEYNVSDGATNIRSLSLGIFYDSENLVWNGLAKDGVLGLRDKPSSGSSNTLIKQWESSHGEFSSLADYPDDDRDFTDKNEDTKRWVFLQWNYSQDDQLRTFQDPTDEKGFIGDRELPVKLVERMSFIRQSDFVDGSTTIRFKVGKVARGLAGHEHDISWLEKAPLIIKANPDTSNTDESDSKANPDTSNTDESDSGGAISASLGQVITKDFENDTSKYIEITPKLVANKTYNVGDIFEFEVLLTADTSEIPSLLLYLDFDENILSWNGVYANSIQGISLAPGIRFNSEEQLLREDTWQEKYCKHQGRTECFGEFEEIMENLHLDDNGNYELFGPLKSEFDERQLSKIALRWRRDPAYNGTHNLGYLGFLPYVPNKL